MKTFSFYSVALIALLVGLPDMALSATPKGANKEPQHVLVLLSYHHGHSWEDDILRGFETWGGAQAERPVFHVEWMDTKRYATAEYRQRYQQFLEEKYADRRFDLIATADDIALTHAVNATPWRDVPIVFSGINGDPPAIIGDRGRVTGIAERFNVGKTLRLALSLHPDARRFIFITADDESGAGNRQNIDANLADLPPDIRSRLTVEHWSPSSLDQINARLSALPKDAVVFALGSIPKERGGRPLGNEQLVAHVRTIKRGAVYSDTDRSVGLGAVGGYVNSGFENGRLMAQMARRILAGEATENVPVVYDTPQVLLIDFNELQRLGVSNTQLPADAKVLNRPPSIFDPERRATLNGLIAGVLFLILILGGLVMRGRQRIFRIERESALELQAANEALLRAKSAEAAILGGSVERVYAEIAALGSDSITQSGKAGGQTKGSILDEVALARANLAQVDAERKQAEAALRNSRDQLCEAQRIAAVGSWSMDLLSQHLECTEEIYRIFEIDPTRFDASYEALLDAIHPEDRDMVNRVYREALANRTPYEIEHRLLFSDGRIKHVLERGETLFTEDDELPILSRGTVQDITERKDNEEALLLYAKVFEHSGEAIMITDADNCIVLVNAAFTQLTGYTLDEIRGKNPSVLASKRTPPETYQTMWGHLQTSGHWQGELWDQTKDGHVYPKWTNISVLRNPAGAVTLHVASFVDISERKAAEEHISRLAHHDHLTGLFNRFSLYQRLEQALLAAHRDGMEVAIMLIDLDRFKSINDTLGHPAGDALLVEVAQRIQNTVRESDIVARLGGDEFVVVLTGVESAMAAGASIASKFLHQLGQPYAYQDRLLHSTPSIGVSLYPTDGTDIEALMKHADIAMYAAKAQGRNTFQFFSAAMNERAIDRMHIEQDLRIAVERGEFELHYQPQIVADDGRISGLEALVRWHHPQKGMISPLKFIPVAEEIGLIEELGAWVLNESCRQFAEWKTVGIRAERIAVNLSAHQLRSPEFVELVRTTMRRHGIGEGELELEVTESVAMEDPKQAIAQLTALRELGVELAIDDFGTGYSSLAYLKLLPIQSLKLDRAFVKDIEIDENDATISLATIALAHSLGLKVVAEGVETEAQRDFLASHGCDILQGYLFSKPLPADEAAAFMRAL